MTILDNLFGLWWVAISSTAASVLVFQWGLLGPHRTRSARFMLATALAALAISYWWHLGWGFDPAQAELRRGAGIVWFPSMCVVAWQIMHFTKHQNITAQKALDQVRNGTQPYGGYDA